MLHFFRDNRKKLAAENRFSRYLFYVIGEIFIVIIGILLALQVDNWNTQRAEREEGRVFMERLKNEFLDNRAQMVQKIEMRSRALASARELMRFIDGETGEMPASRVDSLLAIALPVYTFDPSLGVLNQLTSTDKLTLIRNESLNDKLSIWNAMIEDFKEDEDMYNSFNHNQFRPFLYKNYNGRNIINTRIQNRVINPILLASPKIVNEEIGFSPHAVSPEVLRGSMEFESYLAFIISWLSLINTQSQGILDHIDSVIAIIDQEVSIGA
ncbi:DUF6090 family protein [Robiginitalea sp. SC105]|uniref:DUF6090 family protein n=1 Tax=Robiginitalea sp. SC105 TaxID=2762332 RepID=UPI00163A9A45|nr:DUF6090 family protein [Robiginitalea sp. SC105]MBC2838138.1 hypothetical protein [Robiginitalea sp. SC105]